MTTEAPRCRYCGALIRKRTDTVTFMHSSREGWRSPSYGKVAFCDTPPRNMAEAQRLAGNARVVAVQYSENWDVAVPGAERRVQAASPPVGRHVMSVSVWDGESYRDRFFCNGDHARKFAYALAREGYGTTTYFNTVEAAQ